MRPLLVAILLLLASFAANGAIVYSQPPGNPPGGGIPSQWWYDPTRQNNLDSDAEACGNFVLAKATTITHVDWWGEAGPSVLRPMRRGAGHRVSAVTTSSVIPCPRSARGALGDL